jgi:hypothetical protein
MFRIMGTSKNLTASQSDAMPIFVYPPLSQPGFYLMPVASEESNYTGAFRGSVSAYCQAFRELATLAPSANLTFAAGTSVSFPTKMTGRLAERLLWLSTAVRAEFGAPLVVRCPCRCPACPPSDFCFLPRSQVLQSFLAASDTQSTPSPHFEGRSADITLPGSPSASHLARLMVCLQLMEKGERREVGEKERKKWMDRDEE